MTLYCLLPLLVCISLSLGRLSGHQQGLRAPPLPPAQEPEVPTERWFRQRRDHFRATEGRTWKQRYWVSRQFYKEGGPTLLMVGGEGEVNPRQFFTKITLINNQFLCEGGLLLAPGCPMQMPRELPWFFWSTDTMARAGPPRT